MIFNAVGTSFVDHINCLITGQVRAPNATVNFNGTTPIVNGQVIANYLNMNGGKITGNVSVTPPPDTQLPAVAITTPANNYTTYDASISVGGTASDAGQYQSGVAQVFVNNTAASYNAADVDDQGGAMRWARTPSWRAP